MNTETTIINHPIVEGDINFNPNDTIQEISDFIHEIEVDNETEDQIRNYTVNGCEYTIFNNKLYYIHLENTGRQVQVLIGDYIFPIGKIYGKSGIRILFEFMSVINKNIITTSMMMSQIKSISNLSQNLASLGYSLNSGSKRAAAALADFLVDLEDERILVHKEAFFPGWYNDYKVFVLPSEIIGNNIDNYFYTGSLAPNLTESSCTLTEWKNNVANICAGYNYLEFAIYYGFTPILSNITKNGYMIHYYGPSSIGKSTAQSVISSMWGNKALFGKSWQGTGNAIQQSLIDHRNLPFLLDEASRYEDYRGNNTFVSTAYDLCAPESKLRGLWKNNIGMEVIYSENKYPRIFSNGEIKAEGKNAGQMVRIVNIHVKKITKDLDHTNMLNENCSKYHGIAAKKLIEYIIDKRIDIEKLYQKYLSESHDFLDLVIHNEQSRVMKYFLEILLLAELAMNIGILPSSFKPRETILGIFKEWLILYEIPFDDKKLLLDLRDALDAGYPHFVPRLEKETRETIGYMHEDDFYLKITQFNKVYVKNHLSLQGIKKLFLDYKIISEFDRKQIRTYSGPRTLYRINLNELSAITKGDTI